MRNSLQRCAAHNWATALPPCLRGINSRAPATCWACLCAVLLLLLLLLLLNSSGRQPPSFSPVKHAEQARFCFRVFIQVQCRNVRILLQREQLCDAAVGLLPVTSYMGPEAFRPVSAPVCSHHTDAPSLHGCQAVSQQLILAFIRLLQELGADDLSRRRRWASPTEKQASLPLAAIATLLKLLVAGGVAGSCAKARPSTQSRLVPPRLAFEVTGELRYCPMY